MTTNFTADAKLFHEACAGFGTDEAKLIRSICNKTHEQLVGISRAYTQEYKKDMIATVKDETSGDFEAILVALITPLDDLDALLFFDAVRGVGTNEALLSELLTTRTPAELARIAARYQVLKQENFQERIRSETSGLLQTLYLHLVDGKQAPDTSERATENLAYLIKINEQAPRSQLADDAWLVNCLAGSERSHAIGLADAFKKSTGTELADLIKRNARGDVEQALLMLIQPIVNVQAAMLHRAFSKLDTDEAAIVRLVASIKDRYPGSLNEVATLLKQISGKDLVTWAGQKTGGHFKTSLVMVVSNYPAA